MRFQKIIVSLTASFAGASLIVPLVLLFLVGGLLKPNAFWLGCVGLTLFGVACLLAFSRLEKDESRHRPLLWCCGLAYFAAVLCAVTLSIDSFKAALALGIAEVGGAILCVVGLVHSAFAARRPI